MEGHRLHKITTLCGDLLRNDIGWRAMSVLLYGWKSISLTFDRGSNVWVYSLRKWDIQRLENTEDDDSSSSSLPTMPVKQASPPVFPLLRNARTQKTRNS